MSLFADCVISKDEVSLGNADDIAFAHSVMNCRCSSPFYNLITARLLSCTAHGLTASQFAFPASPPLADIISINSSTTPFVFFSLKGGQLFILEDFHVHSVTEMCFGTS